MDYKTLKQYMTATHFYGQVTDDQFNQLAVQHFMTKLGGVRFVGTHQPVTMLSNQEILPTEQDLMEEAAKQEPSDDQA